MLESNWRFIAGLYHERIVTFGSTAVTGHREGRHPSLVPRAHHFYCVDRLQYPVLQQRVGEHLFSSPFSRSSSFSRFASLMSIMPNSRFQRWTVTSEMFRSLQTSMMIRPLSASRKMRILP